MSSHVRREASMKNICWTLLLVAASSIPAIAQKADFSGRWKLNLARSFMAGDHPAADYALTKIIVQNGSSIKQTDVVVHRAMMNIPMPDSQITMEFLVDGQAHDIQGPSVFPGMPPSQLKVTAAWQGCTLLVTEVGQGFGGASTTERRFFQSEDGKQLIELLESHTGFGDTEQKLIFDKQP